MIDATREVAPLNVVPDHNTDDFIYLPTVI